METNDNLQASRGVVKEMTVAMQSSGRAQIFSTPESETPPLLSIGTVLIIKEPKKKKRKKGLTMLKMGTRKSEEYEEMWMCEVSFL